MKIRVFYHSETGNTRLVALAMAEALGVKAEPVAPAQGRIEADLLFLGGAVYATHEHSLHPSLEGFIRRLDPQAVRQVLLFRTGLSDDALVAMRGLLQARGIAVAKESFSCKGKLFMVFNFGHPNRQDLEDAREFARRLAAAQA